METRSWPIATVSLAACWDESCTTSPVTPFETKCTVTRTDPSRVADARAECKRLAAAGEDRTVAALVAELESAVVATIPAKMPKATGSLRWPE
jgi:hypothetical protein